MASSRSTDPRGARRRPARGPSPRGAPARGGAGAFPLPLPGLGGPPPPGPGLVPGLGALPLAGGGAQGGPARAAPPAAPRLRRVRALQLPVLRGLLLRLGPLQVAARAVDDLLRV